MKGGNLFRAKPAGRGENQSSELVVNNGEARADRRFGYRTLAVVRGGRKVARMAPRYSRVGLYSLN